MPAQIFSDRNLERIRAAHKQVKAKTTTAIAEATGEAGEHAVDFVKRHPTFTPRTGNLQDKTEWRTVKVAGGRVLKIRNRAKYAEGIEHGNPPHIIAARRRKALSFVWKGVRVFRRYIRHPGNKPYRFLYKASKSAGRVLEQKLAAKMNQISKTF
jgi:hypothetical protein